MTPLRHGRYRVRSASGPVDLDRALALRARVFRGGGPSDRDSFDDRCEHLLVEDSAGAVVACFRIMEFAGEGDLGASYSAAFYDLSALARTAGPKIELGRFCVDPCAFDPDILRVAWGALTRRVDDIRAGALFGCSSFAGTDAAPYARAFGRLARRHLAPRDLMPGRKAAEVIRLADVRGAQAFQKPMPPLLATYLGMGGWVGDHAVVDRDLETLHVFTCLPVASVPPRRAAALRALAV